MPYVASVLAGLALEVPAGVSDAEAQAARDSVGGALATAADQPSETGEQLVASTQAAFTSGLQVAYAVGAAVLLALAALVAWRRRHATLDESGPT